MGGSREREKNIDECNLTSKAKKKNTCVSGNLTDPTLFSAKVPSQNFFLSFFPTPSPLKKLKKCQFPPLNMPGVYILSEY